MVLSINARNAATNAAVNLIDAGGGTPTVEYGNSDFSTIYVVLNLDAASAFGAAAGGIATANNGPFSGTGIATGTATHRRFKDGNGAVIDTNDAITDAVTALLNIGAGVATLDYGNSDFSTIYLSISLDTTAFGASSGGVATANGLPKTATATATGTATHYRYSDRDGTNVDERALPTTRNFVSGQSYTVNVLTYTAVNYQELLTTSVDIVSGETLTENEITYTTPAS